MKKLIFLCFLVLGLCLVRAQTGQAVPSPERSTTDSDYAKTANYIMKTAMKLPPHILPTLEELDTKDVKHSIDQQLGVYVPEQRNPLGIYIPRPVSGPPPQAQGLTRPKRQRPKKPRTNQIISKVSDDNMPTFTVPIKSNSPIGKFFGFSKKPPGSKKNPRPRQQPHNLLQSASEKTSTRQGQRRFIKPPPRTNESKKTPYEYEPTDFEFPKNFDPMQKPDEPQFQHQLQGHKRNDHLGRTRQNPNQVEKYVPTFMKEVLAKSFLNNPDQYLTKLRARERGHMKSRNKYQVERSSGPTRKPGSNNLYDPFRPHPSLVSPTPPSLKFDTNFPWNPNSYDNGGRKFKGGYVYNQDDLAYNLDHQKQYEGLNLDSEDAQSDNQVIRNQFVEMDEAEETAQKAPEINPQTDIVSEKASNEESPLTRTICFCCENQNQESGNGSRRKRSLSRTGRKIQIPNPRQSARVLKHQDFLRRSLNCVDQEPIEVVLVFNNRQDSRSRVESVTPKDLSIMEISQRNWELHKNRNRQKESELGINDEESRDSKPFFSKNLVFDDEQGDDEEIEEEVFSNEYYDPAKLTYIFSTPSPLVKKSSDSAEDQFPNHKSNSGHEEQATIEDQSASKRMYQQEPIDQLDQQSTVRIDRKPIDQLDQQSTDRIDRKPSDQLEQESMERLDRKPIHRRVHHPPSQTNHKIVNQRRRQFINQEPSNQRVEVEPEERMDSSSDEEESDDELENIEEMVQTEFNRLNLRQKFRTHFPHALDSEGETSESVSETDSSGSFSLSPPPPVKKRQRKPTKIDATPETEIVAETTVDVVAATTMPSMTSLVPEEKERKTLDKLEENFPMERRYDVSHAISPGDPRVTSVDKIRNQPRAQNLRHHRPYSRDYPKLENHQNHQAESVLSSHNTDGYYPTVITFDYTTIQPDFETQMFTESSSTTVTTTSTTASTVEAKTDSSVKAKVASPDMTSGYLFWRMLTG